MTTAAILPPRLRKEIRGLLPAWLACFALMAVCAALGNRMLFVVLVAYLFGSVSLGALSMGQEYNCRTLTLLLSQPAGRGRLFLEKLAVLAGMLLVLCAVAWLRLSEAVPVDQRIQWFRQTPTLVLPLLCGLFLAPWLTMVCRNALAGIVFAVAIPGTVWVVSDMTSALIYGGELAALAEAGNFTFELFWRGMLIVCIVAAASSWWMFMRLEAIESRGLEVHLPSWLSWRAVPDAANPALKRHALWLLAKKELRLQQLTFAVSGLYLLGCVSVFLLRQFAPQFQNYVLTVLTALHTGAIPLLAGSLASAEERQLGTVEWQVLLPMPAWKQWAAKTGLALSVALVLAIGLPFAIAYFVPSPAIRSELASVYPLPIVLAVITVTLASLYVSSLCANGLVALMVSVPVAGVLALATRWLMNPIYRRYGIPLVIIPARYQVGFFGTRETALRTVLMALLVVMFAGTLAQLLRFAMANHRSAERGLTRVWMQLAALIGPLVAASLIWVGIFIFYADGVNQRIEAAIDQRRANREIATFTIEDGTNTAARDAVVILFPDYKYQDGSLLSAFALLTADADGHFRQMILDGDTRYSALAVARPGTSAAALERELRSKPERRLQLRQNAVALTLRPGESTTIPLKLTTVP